MITYRVLQVQDNSDSSDFIPATSSYSPGGSVPQMISGTNLNGPIYVIGNADSYTSSARPIAPKITGDNSVVLQVKNKVSDLILGLFK